MLARSGDGGEAPQGYVRFAGLIPRTPDGARGCGRRSTAGRRGSPAGPAAGSVSAATSHSASDGKRRPAQRANALASYHETWTTGACGRSGARSSSKHRVTQPSSPLALPARPTRQ
jgi:hypothetical protein